LNGGNENQQQCTALQDNLVQAYIDDMEKLLQESPTSREISEVGMLARARTFIALEWLGPSGKEVVMRFLAKADLVQSVVESDPIVSLASVNLSGVDLSGVDLNGADLRVANLMGADLSGADLSGAQMYQIQLRKADLEGADLRGADIGGTADLQFANLSDAVMKEANLRGANLSGANLSDADLRSAYMEYVVTFGADLRGADLRGAKKFGLPMEGTTDFPELGDTTMPDGSIRDTPNQATERTEDQLAES